MTRWTLEPEIEAEIAEIAAAGGCELIHAEWKGGVLRLILDRPPASTAASPMSETWATSETSAASEPPAATPEVAGVSLGDCQHVAKQTSALLDLLDFGNGRYLLEVSSPGLDRQLYRPSDYERFLGRLARVTYEAAASAHPAHPAGIADAGGPTAAGSPRRRTVVARLAEFRAPRALGTAPDAGEVTLVDDRTGERLTLKLQDIIVARLEVEL